MTCTCPDAGLLRRAGRGLALAGRASCADSAKGACPFGNPFSAAAGDRRAAIANTEPFAVLPS
ncbi:hypothetical protein D7X33_06065 [Butyricicoccus sp. 1XD8-22]|nr:hypothetical protein D7X33_06065 [Butyricicoccus sp. 1XD8-22]